MILLSDRQHAIELIDEATSSGARLFKACQEMDMSVRTYQRWTSTDEVKADGRPSAVRPVPGNRLSQAERAAIVEVVNRPEYQSLPPSQIVPDLADQGHYIASESSFYRVLRDHQMVQHRGPTTQTTTSGKTDPPSDWTESGLVLGHLMDSGSGQRDVLLPLSRAGYLQP